MPCRMRWLLAATALVMSLGTGVSALAQTLPNLTLTRVLYNTRKATVKPDGDLKREIDAIDRALAEALRFGQAGEARRLYARGLTLLSGRAWTDTLDYANSVVLRAERVFVDPASPFTIRIEQIYAPTLNLPAPPDARVRLLRSPGAPRAGASAPPGVAVREFGPFEGVPRDLRESPFFIDFDVAGVGDGGYLVDVELVAGGQVLATRNLPVEIRAGLDQRLANLTSRLARISGEAAQSYRADVLYPADHIRKVNRGVVPFGDFNVEIELQRAEAVLGVLEAGKDPDAGRSGDIKRHYVFAEAGEVMPYRVYVPRAYTGNRSFPLVVALHGLGATENSFFTGYGKRLPALAEERGYLVVAPLGYRVDGGYGGMNVASQDPAERRKRDLSEADVLNVVDLMRKQYRVDQDRIYLLGHSMGAIGTWALGAKYPDLWAALAPFSGLGAPALVERMRDIPQFVVHGDADLTVSVNGSRAMVAEMKRLGVDHRYLEIAGGTHTDVVEPNLAAAFDFFDSRRRKPRGVSFCSVVSDQAVRACLPLARRM